MSQQRDEQIGELLRQYASEIESGMATPDAGRVWRKAEAYRKETAIRRAMRSLLVMRMLGGIYAIAMLAWYVNSYVKTPAGKAMMAMMSAMGGGSALAVGLVLMATAAGAGFLLYEGHRETLST